MTVAHTSDPAPPARRVALLRAVNVGGANALDMTALVAVARMLGWQHLDTYLRTGNLLFVAEGAPAEQAAALHTAIAEELNLDVAVVIRSAEQLAALVDGHPFRDGDPARAVIACCDRPVSGEAAARLRALVMGAERLAVDGADIFADFPDGQGRSKLALGMARAVRPAVVTARNLVTMRRLVAMTAQ